VIAGLDWVAKNGPRPGVANMSLGGGASSSLDNAVKALYKAGIVTAVAAGNSNLDACTVSPARTPEAMTVGGPSPIPEPLGVRDEELLPAVDLVVHPSEGHRWNVV
jgi:subtilisin family serine protease